MAKCHHCGVDADDDDDFLPKRCTTCGGEGVFCTICGWWELGPTEVFGSKTVGPIMKAFTPRDAVVPCHKDDDEGLNKAARAIHEACKLMTSQTANIFWDDGAEYHVAMWKDDRTSWQEGVTAAVDWLDPYLSADPNDKLAQRMRAMLVTWLSAYELCLSSQLSRLSGDDAKALLSLHDTSAVAAKHYALHKGFGIDGKTVDLDVATLRHMDTIEQYLKGNLKPQFAAVAILDTLPNPNDAAAAVIHAGMLYSAVLAVVRDYAKNKVPSPDTFSPASNGASGIYRKNDIHACFRDGDTSLVSMAYQKRIRLLADAVLTCPDFQGRPFRFNSQASDDVIDNRGSLTGPQKLYLKSVQDLDDPQSPSACQPVIRARVKKRLEKLRAGLAQSERVTSLLKPVFGLNPFEAMKTDTLIDMIVAYGRKGRLRLQTCANDISFISNKRYEGILSVFAADVTFAVALAPCSAATGCNDKLTGSKYTKTEVKKASDTRKKTPFQYMSWRVQKDRMAHKFLPLAYSDYDVTAAVTQTYPYPEPQGTYGKQLIVWKKDIVPFCTFKVGDSGRPTRSFLLLLDDLLQMAVDRAEMFTKIAVVNLLLQSLVPDCDTRELLDAYISKDLQDFPIRFRRGDDIEAHLYGNLRLADVDVIFYPCKANEVNATRLTATQLFGNTPVILFDTDTFATRETFVEDGDQGMATIESVGTLML